MRTTKKLLSLILSVAMVISLFTFATVQTASAAVTNSFDGSEIIRIKNTDVKVINTVGHGGIGGKSADDPAGYVTVMDGAEPLAGGDCYFNNPWANGAADGARVLIAIDVFFTDPNTQLCFEYHRTYENEDDTTSTQGLNKFVHIGAAYGLKRNNSNLPVVDENAPTSLSINEWHNIAVEVANDGTKAVNVYIDGVKYACEMSGVSIKEHRFRLNFYRGSMYYDNYYCYEDAAGTDMYAEESFAMDEISVAESDKVTYNEAAKQFAITDETLTVGELKEVISTDYSVAVYEDATCSTALEDDDTVSMANVVVLYNGAKSFRYYDFERVNNTNYTYEVNADGVTCSVTGFIDGFTPVEADDTVIPEKIAGYTVTQIGDNAFAGIKTLGLVTFPDTIKVIGASAFAKSYGVDIEKWPASLEVVEASAFYNAKDSAVIKGDFTNTKLHTLENAAFSCSGLTGIVLPDTLEYLGAQALRWCDIKDIVIPDSVTYMGDEVFQDAYSGAKSVRFPENSSVTEIPSGTFESSYPDRAKQLFGDLKLYIPETITTIPDILLKDFKDGATVTIYGAKRSAAMIFYENIKAQLEAGTYTNGATCGEEGAYTDADGDGLGEIGEIVFVEYDFEADQENIIDETGYNFGDGSKWTQSTGSGCTDPITEFETVEGGMGKAAGDTAVYFETTDGSAGHNYKGSSGTNGAYYMELTTRAPQTGETYVGVSLAYYNTSDRKDDTDGDGKTDGYTTDSPFRIYNNRILVFGNEVAEATSGRWYTVAFTVPNDGSTSAKVWINGTEYTRELANACYGVRHSRLFTWATADYPAKTYYDNYRVYTSTARKYNPKHDIPAQLISASDTVKISGENIFIDPDVTYTAGELKQLLTVYDANIRIYEDSSFEKVLSDTDTVTNTAVVVVGTTNG